MLFREQTLRAIDVWRGALGEQNRTRREPGSGALYAPRWFPADVPDVREQRIHGRSTTMFAFMAGTSVRFVLVAYFR